MHEKIEYELNLQSDIIKLQMKEKETRMKKGSIVRIMFISGSSGEGICQGGNGNNSGKCETICTDC